MKKLINFELLKLKKQKSVYITAIVMIVLLFINVLTLYGMAKLGGLLEDEISGELGAEGDMLMEMLSVDVISTVLGAAGNSSYSVIIGIVITLFVCRDYTQGTIKNVIARGARREQVYLAKLAAVTVVALALYILVVLFGFLFGLMFFGFDAPDSARWLGVLGVQVVAALGTAYLAFFASSIIRKVGPSLLVIIILPTVAELALTLIDVFLETHISDYFITTVFTFLSQPSVSVSRIIGSLITSLAYVAAFIGGGYFLSRKSEY